MKGCPFPIVSRLATMRAAAVAVVSLCLVAPTEADYRKDGVECLQAWEKREVDRAIAACTRAIESGKISGELLGTTYWLRANAYRAKGDLDRALADFSRSISLKPGEFSSYVNRGIIYSIKGDHERAIADFTEAIRLEPDHPFPYYNRGYVRFQRKEYDQAVDDFSRAIARKKDYAVAYYYRAQSYGRQKRYREALDDYSSAIEHNIGYTDAYVSRGLLQEAFGETAGAIESYKAAASRPPNGPRGPDAVAKARERLAALAPK